MAISDDSVPSLRARRVPSTTISPLPTATSSVSCAAAGVIGDYRDPDILRFGFSPLYTSYAEAERAARLLRDILNAQTYLEPVFQVRQTVT